MFITEVRNSGKGLRVYRDSSEQQRLQEQEIITPKPRVADQTRRRVIGELGTVNSAFKRGFGRSKA